MTNNYTTEVETKGVISLRTYDNFSPLDDMLVNTSIEIKVYP